LVYLAQHPLDHFFTVIFQRNHHIATVPADRDEVPLGQHMYHLPAHFNNRLRVVIAAARIATIPATAGLAGTWRSGNEVGAEQVGDPGVVLHPELVLLSRLINAGAAADHLIESNG
jgi:hypothetical protein